MALALSLPCIYPIPWEWTICLKIPYLFDLCQDRDEAYLSFYLWRILTTTWSKHRNPGMLCQYWVHGWHDTIIVIFTYIPHGVHVHVFWQICYTCLQVPCYILQSWKSSNMHIFISDHIGAAANIQFNSIQFNSIQFNMQSSLHLHKIVEGLYFHCSLSVCVCVYVCVCVRLCLWTAEFQPNGRGFYAKWLLTTLAQTLLKLVTLGQRSRSQ